MDDSPALHTIPAAVLDRYLAGTASAEDAARVDAWATAHDLRDVVAALQGAGAHVDARRMAADWETIVRRTTEPDVVGTPSARRDAMDIPPRGRHRSPHPSGRWQAAWAWRTKPATLVTSAIVAVLLVMTTLVGRTFQTAARQSAVPNAYTMYTTPRGQVAHLTLPDGTHLIIAPGSHVGVARNFSSHRDVTLLGEAYFDVAPQQHIPFLVHTGTVTTRVLGTTFDVRHYDTNAVTQVAVVSGKVAVGASRQPSVTLVAGSVGRVTDSTAVATRVSDVTDLTAWTAGRLRFRDAPLPEVLVQLSRWYDVDFELADSTLMRETVTTTIAYTETKDVVHALEVLLDVTATTGGTHLGQPVIVLRARRVMPLSPAARLRFAPRSSIRTEVGR
jgi:ferric-dicitrate binding protein FerR (iron transport regulator)